MGGEQLLKRIPRIKFPKRHGNISSSETSKSKDNYQFSMAKSDVPAPPLNTAVGGKASLQPKRTPVTDREIEAVLEETRDESESDDDEQQMCNPLKLPVGWDVKPIPYWLYKLHGLGQEFKCEICGNYSYWGRRAYERHFKEWRHQHGMRCLGIPNTKNFNEITSIEEAKELWKEIQEKQGVNKWRPDLEDREGNIYNKGTCTDRQRQGLI